VVFIKNAIYIIKNPFLLAVMGKATAKIKPPKQQRITNQLLFTLVEA
jgi:hypothetical protein